MTGSWLVCVKCQPRCIVSAACLLIIYCYLEADHVGSLKFVFQFSCGIYVGLCHGFVYGFMIVCRESNTHIICKNVPAPAVNDKTLPQLLLAGLPTQL